VSSRLLKQKVALRDKKNFVQKLMKNLLTEVMLIKINNKISLYSLYLKTIKRQHIYSLVEDTEVVLVSERNNTGLKKLFCRNG
jgi:hypothetical protein